MKLIIFLVAVSVPAITHANALIGQQPTMNEPNYSTQRSLNTGDNRVLDTPAMRQRKLMRALALRDEAARLLDENGGVVTPQYRAYVNRKARDILGDR